jgi:hypothetical protein
MRLLRFDVMRLFGYLIKRPYSPIRIKKPETTITDQNRNRTLPASLHLHHLERLHLVQLGPFYFLATGKYIRKSRTVR